MTKNEMDFLFEERKNFILIGLTGRTGCGCSEVANLLQEENFDNLNLDKPNDNLKNNKERKYKIIYNYMKNNWGKFERIHVASIITTFILENSFEDFKNFIQEIDSNIELDSLQKNTNLLEKNTLMVLDLLKMIYIMERKSMKVKKIILENYVSFI